MRAPGWVALLLLLPLAACTTDTEEPGVQPGDRAPTSSASPSASPSASASGTPSPVAPSETLPPVPDPRSLPALMREDFRASRIRYGEVIEQTDRYTRYQVTYRSGDLTVSGILLRPRGRGPFPGIVLNHGYIEPAYYAPGQGLAREQIALADAGFAVLHTDYRGHAGSDPAGELSRQTRLGYTRDAIHAVLALEREPYVDEDRMAMLGRSMGGGVTLNALVVAPGLVDAAVIYASVSSRYLDNLRHFVEPERPDEVTALYDALGTPRSAPEVYAGLSPRSYFDRITEPVLAHHADTDETCPFPWAVTTDRALRRAGVDAQLEVYRGEAHAFSFDWQRSMDRTITFLRRRLG
ncbi:S9 family peptidase [Nocardioides sp. cx-173]|uniref:alpha/beta hydrolase family protein n=1 Tax=Nocardioides sp. cx-173 TaxID=2898796 RepID=UPI001E5CAB04|nr:alpha/beta fold hydrolase [Nocardioides sp. cx-173]MCD4526458.1 alpha/beta fold hydrolase [Nocardioides sp. cx-173]UGB44090.1 alpha/beta fold hydrolase [Nocardioides sp. cx-173]